MRSLLVFSCFLANIYAYKWTTLEYAEKVTRPPNSYYGNKILLMQNQVVKTGKAYAFSCSGQVESNPKPSGDIRVGWSSVVLNAAFFKTSGDIEYKAIGRHNMIRREDNWVKFGGDFVVPEGTTSMNLVIYVVDSSIQMKVDPSSVLLERLELNSGWKTEANQRIKELRKGNIKLSIKNSKSYSSSRVKFQLKQVQSAFTRGSAVKGHRLNSTKEEDKRYSQFFYNYFNFGTPEGDVAWRLIEKEEGQPDFTNGDKSIAALAEHGYGARAGLAWGRDRVIPPWILGKSPSEIKNTIERRLKYIAQRYGKKFAQWDVNNEQLHEAWYDEHIGDASFLLWMFRRFHALDGAPTLFLNDYMVFSNGVMTQAYRHQAAKLIKQGAPIGAMGLQAHFLQDVKIELLMKRLEILSEVNLPLWLTEFDVALDDASVNERLFEDVLRLSFSYPKIDGIIFWGFWEQAMWRPKGALCTGPNFSLTNMGKIFQRLFFSEWRTNANFNLPGGCSNSCTWSTDAFYGTFDLVATLDGKQLWTKRIELKTGQNVAVGVTV